MKAHRFVLAARSDNWGVKDLSQVSVLDMTGKTSARYAQRLLQSGFMQGAESLECSWIFTEFLLNVLECC